MSATGASKGFEISSIQMSDTTIVDMLHPGDGSNLGATMEVYGEDAEHYRKLQRDVSARYAAFAQKHNFKKTMPPEQAEALELTKDVQSVKAFSGFTSGGEPLAFSEDAVRALFVQFPSFREQVRTARAERALFIRS